MVGRSVSNYGVPAREIYLILPDFEHNIPIGQALLEMVPMGKIEKSLGWLARNMPHKIEELMSTLEPGSRLFSACCTVYNSPRLEPRIKDAVGRRNGECQSGTITALSKMRKTGGKKLRKHRIRG